MDSGDWQAILHGVTRVGHNLATKQQQQIMIYIHNYVIYIYVNTYVHYIEVIIYNDVIMCVYIYIYDKNKRKEIKEII